MAKSSTLTSAEFNIGVEPVDAPARQVSPVERRVKQMVRWISRQNAFDAQGRFEPIGIVDTELSGYLAAGYHLVNTHYLGENPEAYGVLYVLVLD